MTAPDVVGEVRGYRHWSLLPGGRLQSLTTPVVWEEDATAECVSGWHPAPAAGCSCGLYAWYRTPTWPDIRFLRLTVAGVVAASGRVQLHADGFRAERMRIVALANTPSARGTGVWQRYPVPFFPDVDAMVAAYPPQDMTALIGPAEEVRWERALASRRQRGTGPRPPRRDGRG